MSRPKQLMSLDVGTARIGVAFGNSSVRIAIPSGVVDVDGNERLGLARLVVDNHIDTIVVGYPRNQSGEVTQQTQYVEQFAEGLNDLDATVLFQDESLTSVEAEKRLIARGTAYTKADIDSEAAVIILQDYMEQNL